MTPITVFELNEYVRLSLAENPLLSSLCVEGEVSGLKRHSSGHIYFTLKDERAQINCVFFAGDQRGSCAAQNGMRVQVRGYVSLYTRDGRYQFYVKSMEENGAGMLYLQFERLKRELAEKGYFDAERKRAIPFFPKRIGVVTSPTGAVFSDICDVARRRFPKIQLVLAPVAVQGPEAPASIVRGIESVNAMDDIDVLIVGRGGGSMEDLWCFNDEAVVEAIVHSRIPIISAIGHETDFTLADFAADLRAPTPSAAAELATPELVELESVLVDFALRASRQLDGNFRTAQERLERAASCRVIRFPEQLLDQPRQRLDMAEQLLDMRMEKLQQAKTHRLAQCVAKAESLSPLKILARGYAAVTDEANQLVKSAAQARQTGTMQITFADGAVKVKAEG